MALASPTMFPERLLSVLKRLTLTLDCVWAHIPVSNAMIPATTRSAMSAGRRCAVSSVSRIQATAAEP